MTNNKQSKEEKEIEEHNVKNYHNLSDNYGMIDDKFEELAGCMENSEGIKSQLIAEELGLTEDDEIEVMTPTEIENHNINNYHRKPKNWKWIGNTYSGLVDNKCGYIFINESMSTIESMKSQLIAESMGLTEDDG